MSFSPKRFTLTKGIQKRTENKKIHRSVNIVLKASCCVKSVPFSITGVSTPLFTVTKTSGNNQIAKFITECDLKLKLKLSVIFLFKLRIIIQKIPQQEIWNVTCSEDIRIYNLVSFVKQAGNGPSRRPAQGVGGSKHFKEFWLKNRPN